MKVQRAMSIWARFYRRSNAIPTPHIEAESDEDRLRAAIAPEFDPEAYLAAFPELTAAQADPLRHVVKHGAADNRLSRMGLLDRSRYARGNDRSVSDRDLILEEGRLFRMDAEARIRDAIVAKFDPAAYIAAFPDVAVAEISPLQHAIKYGVAENRLSRMGLLSRSRYARGKDRNVSDRELILEEGLLTPVETASDDDRLRAAIEAEFDPDAYLAAFPELAAARVDPLRHVVRHGAADNRLSRMGLLDRSRYARGNDRNVSDRDLILEEGQLLRVEAETDDTVIDRVGKLLDLLGMPYSAATIEALSRYAVAMFDPEDYRRRHGLAEELTPAELLARYVLVHYPRGEAPGLFDAEFYAAALAQRGLEVVPPQTLFQHWISDGVERRISPTPLFDEDEYLAINPELKHYSGWLFEHWLVRGLSERRPFDRNVWVAKNYGNASHPGGGLTDFVRMATRTPGYAAALLDQRTFRTSTKFAQLVAEAHQLDPNISPAEIKIPSLIPPIHDENYAAYLQALRIIPKGQFDVLLLMPFCKLGGADFVAGVFSKSLAALGARTLILRTDQRDFERPDWFPANVPNIDISGAIKSIPEQYRTRALYEIIRAVGAPITVNINSRLAFDTITTFSGRIKLFTDLYCYYFCSDRDKDGREVGYPVWYFAQILPDLAGAFIDTHYLADTLKQRYALTASQEARIKVLYTPPNGPSVDQAAASSANASRRPRVLWAGRFDRQKRFDLLVEVARRMPHVEFDAWGKAVLDAPPDLTNLPANLTIHPPFKTFSELPIFDAHGWLYTSDWDGMPTILIEIANLGVAVVASAVGGIPELIDETTGWPLAPDADAATTAATVEAMLADHEGRQRRGLALMERVRTHHSRQAYDAAVAAMLDAAGVTLDRD